MATVLSAFNNQFKKFVDDILTIFPDNADLRKAETGLEWLRKYNPRMVIQFWKGYIVARYQPRIEAGDISFFLDKDYSEDVKSYATSPQIIDAIEKLRQPIREMGAVNQQMCMNYIQTLTKLANMY